MDKTGIIFLPFSLFAYQTRKQKSTKIEPFYLVYGRQAMYPININEDITVVNYVSHLINELPIKSMKRK